MIENIDKNLDSAEIEARQQKFWDENNFWACDPDSSKKPFCTMMPPPNVTGTLHLGHILDNAATDFMCRYKRMKGFDVFWQPGMDHASIAAQMLYEKHLSKQKINPKALSNEDLLAGMWPWVEEVKGGIRGQLKRLGITPDWSREAFTMDEDLSKAVNKMFLKMHKDGFIYRGEYMSNWCPKQQTVVSDLEVDNVEEKGFMYYINYPVVGSNEKIMVATTRPETLFGDMAVAVNAEDEKHKHLIGKKVHLPLTDREIPIVADEHADPEKGTGAVKITPAHDFNDFEVGKRHNLENLTVLNEYAKMNEKCPEKYQGMDRFACRKEAILDLKELGLFVKEEEHLMQVPYSERGKVVVEPRITMQWYVDVQSMAEKAIDVVEKGEITFSPDHRKNLYMAWMKEIRPWPISRQLWWGHKIPAWYAEDGECFIAETVEEAQAQADEKYGKNTPLIQDTDSLDTWFSSGLWPFSTLGWPGETKEYEKYYTTDYMNMGFDLIFFWNARMIMMGLYGTGEVPYKHVNFHGLVRDAKGQKMSKTKGNGTDPDMVMDKYGVDAVRYWASNIPNGVDAKYNEPDVKNSRKVITKLWNSIRFVLMNLEDFTPGEELESSKRCIEDRWLLSELNKSVAEYTRYMDKYDTYQARNTLDTFFWNVFCDDYLEIIKDRFWNPEKYSADDILSAQSTLWEAIRTILALFAPFIPFTTEELYQKIFKEFEGVETLHITAFPEAKDEWNTDVADMDIILGVLKSVRRCRTEQQIGQGKHLKYLRLDTANVAAETIEVLKNHEALLKSISRSQVIEYGAASFSSDDVEGLKLDIEIVEQVQS